MFLYDTHVHSNECSACGQDPAVDMVRSYKEAGYAGFALTNHFYHGNSAIDRSLDWADFVRPYYDAYLAAREEAEKLDLDVIFGIEEGVGRGKELLVYNIDWEVLAHLPELRETDMHTFVDEMHKAGAFVVHAHPYRFRDYMGAVFYEPDFYGCDGIEVFNANNKPEENDRAAEACAKLGLVPTAGIDNHSARCHPDSGVLFTHRAKTAEQFVEALKSPDTRLLQKGKQL